MTIIAERPPLSIPKNKEYRNVLASILTRSRQPSPVSPRSDSAVAACPRKCQVAGFADLVVTYREFKDGCRQLKIVEGELTSSENHVWVET